MRRGFTLIELIISITIFTLFIGVAGTSYVSIARSLRSANALRNTISEARGFLNTIVHDIRSNTIDYDCLVTDCVFYFPGGQRQKFLPLINREQTERVLYRFSSGNAEVCKQKKTISNTAGVSTSIWEPCGFQLIEMPSFSVSHLQFLITPALDPFDATHATDDSVQFQPSVTVLLSGQSIPGHPTDAPLDFQTTISSRMYFPHRTP